MRFAHPGRHEDVAQATPSEIGHRPNVSLPPRHFSLKPVSCCIGYFVVTIPRQSSSSASSGSAATFKF